MKHPHTCECCGQLIPPDNPFLDKPVKARIYDCIVKHTAGIQPERVKDIVYADAPDGGPSSTSILSNHVRQMNVVLAKRGVKIWTRRGPHAGYRLVAL